MDLTTFKIYLSSALLITMNIPELLKSVLTAVVIGYTVYKWYTMYQDRNKPKDKK
jgi:hypothetical protein